MSAVHNGPERVLIVDDAIENLNLLTVILENAGLEVVAAPSAEIALQVAKQMPLDLAILDVLMPGTDGIKLCAMLARLGEERGQALPVIFVSGRDDADTIVRAFDAGGVDYLTKPIQEREVVARVENHLRINRLQRELQAQNHALSESYRRLEEQVAQRKAAEEQLRVADARLSEIGEKEAERWGLSGFVGATSSFRKTCEDIRKLHAFARTNVLVLGESGCGKELVARAIHYGGARKDKPFIAINCSAIPAELAESTFFGHIKGSFTGAVTDRKGCFELAHRGTLFLDEIGDLPLPLQAKLLRTLEDGSFLPVGAVSERRADVRIVAATHRDLVLCAEQGDFRQDLYFRLAQYVVHVPPLRERPEDIPLLVAHFLKLFSKEMNLPQVRMAEDAVAALFDYPFPGNVRELKNVVERALIQSGGGRIEREHLSLSTKPRESAASSLPASLNVDEVKAQLVERALELTGGNVSAAARHLGVHRSSLYRRK